MNDVPENELFSAYLDGELTADEQADMERLLASSPAARQLLDELRALSSNLQALPQYKLDEDLSEQVIRAAERKVLARSERLNQPTEQRPSLLRPSLLRRLIESRALVWSGLAVVVAVMLMIGQPQEDRPAGDGGLAVAPPDTPDEPEPSGEEESELGSGPIIEARDSKPAEGKRDESVGYRGKAMVDGTTGDVADNAKARPPEVALEDVAKPDARIVDNKPGGVVGPSKVAARPIAPKIPAGGRSGQLETLPETDLATNAPGESIAGGFVDETGTMVVHCEISSEAARDEVFVRLLVTNGIAMTEVNGRVDAKDVGGGAMFDRLAEVQSGRDREHFQKKPLGKTAAPQRETRARDVELFYTVASREQIEGVLSALLDDEGAVLSLSVDPGTPEQKNLERYNRSISTRRPGLATEKQEAISFGADTQDADGGDKYEGAPTGQAWRIDLVETREKLEQLVRRGDRRRGQQVAAAQMENARQSGEPQSGQTHGGRPTPDIGKGAAGQATAKAESGKWKAEPGNAPPPVLKAESEKRRAESDSDSILPPTAPTATQPGQTAGQVTPPPGADRSAPVAETATADLADNAEKEEGVGAKGQGRGRSQAATQRPRPGKLQPRVEPPEKAETLWQELGRPKVAKYRTLFVLRIVGTASPLASPAAARINASIEPADEPAADAAEEPPAEPANAIRR